MKGKKVRKSEVLANKAMNTVKGKLEDLKKIDKTISKLNNIDVQLNSLEEELEKFATSKSKCKTTKKVVKRISYHQERDGSELQKISGKKK